MWLLMLVLLFGWNEYVVFVYSDYVGFILYMMLICGFSVVWSWFVVMFFRWLLIDWWK